MGVTINLDATIVYDIPCYPGAAMDNEGLEVSPSVERKVFPRSDTSLTQVDLDILSRQQDVSLTDGVSVRYWRSHPLMFCDHSFLSASARWG